MRGRGLKLSQRLLLLIIIWVAPHAGAWIETLFNVNFHGRRKVAPHAGAWIETDDNIRQLAIKLRSPPMRGRGLKPKTWF